MLDLQTFCAGIPVKSTLDNQSTIQYLALIHQLVMKARSTLRDIDPQNDLTFLRVRSKKNEIRIAPGERRLPLIQNPST
uniref:Dynein, light chain, roadblock-type 1 n=1 Tax=Fundulus heteroclitus TaxID=8078 RepID=A0A3Q2PXW3_FUNHE